EASLRTFGNSSDIDENIGLDTPLFVDLGRRDIVMPMQHKVGFSFTKRNNWLIGADFNYGKWSDYKEGDISSGFEDSYGFAVGGNITPDYTSNKYLNVVDYRIGFRYDKTHLLIEDQQIKDM